MHSAATPLPWRPTTCLSVRWVGWKAGTDSMATTSDPTRTERRQTPRCWSQGESFKSHQDDHSLIASLVAIRGEKNPSFISFPYAKLCRLQESLCRSRPSLGFDIFRACWFFNEGVQCLIVLVLLRVLWVFCSGRGTPLRGRLEVVKLDKKGSIICSMHGSKLNIGFKFQMTFKYLVAPHVDHKFMADDGRWTHVRPFLIHCMGRSFGHHMSLEHTCMSHFTGSWE